MKCLQWIPQIKKSLKFRVLPNGKVVIYPAYGLNETASKAFLLIDGKRTIAEIAKILMNEYEVDYNELINDLCDFIELLKELGLVVIVYEG